MKKQELIKHIEDLPYKEGPIVDKIDISRKGLLELVKQLDEPGKVTIPQYVVDWIKYCKLTGVNLYHALEMGDLYFCNYANQKDYSKLKEFFEVKGNQELFVRAWLDGYEVEKEKKYKVVLLNYNDGHLNLVNVRTLGENIIFFTKKTQFEPRSLELTKAEIISSGFGWVFDCPGVQIEEMK